MAAFCNALCPIELVKKLKTLCEKGGSKKRWWKILKEFLETTFISIGKVEFLMYFSVFRLNYLLLTNSQSDYTKIPYPYLHTLQQPYWRFSMLTKRPIHSWFKIQNNILTVELQFLISIHFVPTPQHQIMLILLCIWSDGAYD